jgi:hypothetical protein
MPAAYDPGQAGKSAKPMLNGIEPVKPAALFPAREGCCSAMVLSPVGATRLMAAE